MFADIIAVRTHTKTNNRVTTIDNKLLVDHKKIKEITKSNQEKKVAQCIEANLASHDTLG